MSLSLLTESSCIADLQCLAFRWLRLGVRRPILSVSLQQWIPDEVLELHLTALSLIMYYFQV